MPLLVQGAFTYFVRATLAPGQLQLLPCTEANGSEGIPDEWAGNPRCIGRMLQHFWAEKGELAGRLESAVKPMLLDSMAAHLTRTQDYQPCPPLP
jgi:hypothetical protein